MYAQSLHLDTLPDFLCLSFPNKSISFTLTENFFMERYSYDDKPGGPFQAASKNIDYYIYYYPSHNELFIFNTKQLVRRLDRIMKNEKLVNVKNKGYTTRGYKVKRSLIEDLCLNFEDIGLVESKGKK